MDRRSVLKLGVGSALALAVAGGSLAWLQSGIVRGRLSDSGREVFSAITRGALAPLLPQAAQAQMLAINLQLQWLEQTISGLPPALQTEWSQRLAVLANPPGRLAFAGLAKPRPRASTAQLQRMLESLRSSSLALRQQSYHALRDLSKAAWFIDSHVWSAIGYPGPLALRIPL